MFNIQHRLIILTLVPARCQGPFHISKVISPVAYQLVLPLSWGIHDVFHSSLLLPYQETMTHSPNFMQPPSDLIEGEEEFEVEAVINHRHHGRQRQLQYLIKWKGYPSSDNMWEAAENVHTDDLLKDYHQHHPLGSLKSKSGQGTRRLAHTLYSLTAAHSPSQQIATWLLRSTTPPTRCSTNHPLTLKLSKDRPSISIDHPAPTYIPLNVSTLSSTPVSVTTSTASIIPTHRTWLNHQR